MQIETDLRRGASRMMSRRIFLKDVLALSVVYGVVLSRHKAESQSVPREIRPAGGIGDCGNGSITPNVRPSWKVGQIFRYQTTMTDEKKSSPARTTGGGSGEAVLTDDPIPLQQSITVGREDTFNGESVVLLECEGMVELPAFLMGGDEAAGGVRSQSRSYLNRDGKIRYSESKLSIPMGQSISVSTSRQTEFRVTSDIDYFYGYWMLALTPDFSWQCQDNTPEGALYQRLKVTAMEVIQGRQCFVAEKTRRTEARGSQITTYWVDKEKRIAVQVRTGMYSIQLVSGLV